MISGSHAATQLIKESYRLAIDVGAYPYVKWSGGLAEIFYKKSLEKQLKYLSLVAKFEIENIDAKLGILNPGNTRDMTDADPKKQITYSTTQQEIHEIFLKRAAKMVKCMHMIS